MKYIKFYIPLIGIYYCLLQGHKIEYTLHEDATAFYHAFIVAMIIAGGMWSWAG